MTKLDAHDKEDLCNLCVNKVPAGKIIGTTVTDLESGITRKANVYIPASLQEKIDLLVQQSNKE